MAIEVIDQANPPPLDSQLPSGALLLAARNLHSEPLDDETGAAIRSYRRAADYIAAGNEPFSVANATLTWMQQ